MLDKITRLVPAVIFGGLFLATTLALYGANTSVIYILNWLSSAGASASVYIFSVEKLRKKRDLRFKINITLSVGIFIISSTTLIRQLKAFNFDDYLSILIWVEGVTVALVTSLLWLRTLVASLKR